MNRLFGCLCCLMLGAAAPAVEPPTEVDEHAVQEITDLRSELTDPEIVQATDQEFAEALREGMQSEEEEPQQGRRSPRVGLHDGPPERDTRESRRVEGYWPPHSNQNGGDFTATFRWPPAAHDAPGHGPRGPAPPHVLLRESAFHLDRVAHQLETAEQYREADAVRATAQRLRESARRLASPERRGPREGRVDGRVRPRQDRPRRAREASEP